MAYFTNAGPKSGPFLHRDTMGAAIGVLKAPDKLMPIGVALPVGWDDSGVELWRISIGNAEQPGLWIVVDREFRLAQ
jgi:hypothetical protein